AVGGFTLDYGPFGFCDVFSPYYQPWTGGGQHFAFLNQPVAAERNFHMFCTALQPLLTSLTSQKDCLQQLDQIRGGFSAEMQTQLEQMWAAKLGLDTFNAALFNELQTLMAQTPVDYTIFFRELSTLPDDIGPLKKSFYEAYEGMDKRWSAWLAIWQSLVVSGSANTSTSDANAFKPRSRDQISRQMKLVNPKYILREWFLAPAYRQASAGDYSLIRELQKVMTQPYAEQSKEVEERYYRLKPAELFEMGGLSHLSCSS
ncbi:MAG: protein adenylyltransferase SelO family protein, partial [Rhodoferax sp.]